MSDRQVRQLTPTLQEEDSLKLFSSFMDHSNVVLLGDPGAGKSHLFRYFSEARKDTLFSARSFLNQDAGAIPSSSVIFIDALDEKRAGRGDDDTIDAIVRKLCVIRPNKVRIACRAADWLGQVDLAAFQTYFGSAGGATVVRLEALTESERLMVLKDQGYTAPETFLAEARRRGLEDLLANPQNLIMLATAVNHGNWPRTRGELFLTSVRVLLAEHNVIHAQRGLGNFTGDELFDSAGALCAVRLISDIAGIALSAADATEDCPNYRTIGMVDLDKAQAALERRVFIAGPLVNTVDYTHRTIAEFMAASWLATRIRAGLPLGRVQALLGVDGHPASELRGLHAWLASLLPEHAPTLIDADPFGVLSYGDAASLSPSTREHLMSALARLAETDPWFRGDSWSTPTIAALSTPDMVNVFRSILLDPSSAFTLRSIVLDALAEGVPLPELETTLLTLLLDTGKPYIERECSLKALLKIGSHGKQAILSVYSEFKISSDDVRLRAEMLSALYDDGLSVNGILTLLHDAMEMEDKLPLGSLYRLDEIVPDDDLYVILDCIDLSQIRLEEDLEKRNASEVLRVTDMLLSRYLMLNPEISGEQALAWLSRRLPNEAQGRISGTDHLKTAITSSPGVLVRVVDAWIRNLTVDENRWKNIHYLHKATLHLVDKALLIDRLVQALGQHDDEKDAFLYEAALSNVFHCGTEAISVFEALCRYADDADHLLQVRARCCVCDIPDWMMAEYDRKIAQTSSRSEAREKRIAEFEANRLEIRQGKHLSWLGWIGERYFAGFDAKDYKATPRDRLEAELGVENALTAFDGINALIGHGEITSLADVIRMHVDNKYCRWWFAVIAGLDERSIRGIAIDTLSPDYLRATIAIDCLHPTYRFEENTAHLLEHGWKEEVLRLHPQLAADAYLALARSDLEVDATYIHGLHQLVTLEPLTEFLAHAIKGLLHDFPAVQAQSLRQMLPSALAHIDRTAIIDLVMAGLAACETRENRQDTYLLWLAVGFLAAPDKFKKRILDLEVEHQGALVWELRSIGSLERNEQIRLGTFSLDQLEFVAGLTARHYPKAFLPNRGWVGSQNPWDASELVIRILAQLASDTSIGARDSLLRLARSTDILSYIDNVKHALAQQRSRRTDALYRQPNWRDAVKTLSNGSPTCTEDLHALTLSHLRDINLLISGGNTDAFKRFWNEDSYGRLKTPKNEESARDVLVDHLRTRLYPFGSSVEPEGHMVADKRTDIVVAMPGAKVVIELKRDFHADVWTAMNTQLDRLYTRDPDALGFGIYGVLWYGERRGRRIPIPPSLASAPRSVEEMQRLLESNIPSDKKAKIHVVVIDVSGELRISD